MSTARARLLRRARRYLAIWMTNIGLDNDQGLTDINSDAEDFCCGLLSIVLEAKLQNLNLLQMNFPAIDLADKNRRICVQVTSSTDAEKITHTLECFFAHELEKDYDQLIVMILSKKKKYRTEFPQKEGFSFNPVRDVWDIQKLLTQITGLTMPMLERVDDYLKEQFGDLDELAPSIDLPVLSALDDNSFWGRDAELTEIARRFEQNEKLLILSGLGGMGKTELAVRFALTRWSGESYFVYFTKNWKHTVLENIAPRIRGLKRDTTEKDRIYRDAMTKLKNRGADELLIIDNVDQEESSLTQLKRELSELNLRILITTRTDTERKIPVARLHLTELYRLFDFHNSVATLNEQTALIDAVDGHTLTVDLMARALRPGRRAATAEKLLHNLSDGTIRRVETAYPGAPAQARIIEHLKIVFRVMELDEAERKLLLYATLLPTSGMNDTLFLSPIDADMENALDHLIDNGWLNWNDSLLAIHPVIRKVCIEELNPTGENCGIFLNGLIAKYDAKVHQKDFCRQIAEVLTYASVCLDDIQSSWALTASQYWRNIGNFELAHTCSLRAMEKIEQDSHGGAVLAQIYSHVGRSYGDMGDNSNALKYEKRSLAIREQILPPDHLDLATSYNNIGITYSKLGNHHKALKYERKALEIRKNFFTAPHLSLAISYDNVGCSYGELGDHQTALEYQKKALEFLQIIYLSDHINLAPSFNNVGCTYGELGDHQTALEYHLKALALQEKGLPPNHPDIAQSCNNIAWAHHAMGQYKKAVQYMRRAADIIRRSSLPEDHPHRVNYPNWAIQFEKDAKTL